MPTTNAPLARLGLLLMLLSGPMACKQGSHVEQVKLTSSLETVLDMPERGNEEKPNRQVDDSEQEIYVDGSIAIGEEDTVYTRGYQLLFATADSTYFSPYFPDQEKRNTLTENETNWYKATLLVERYLSFKGEQYFSSTDSTITLALADGQTLELPRWEHNTDEGEHTSYAFEHYFPEAGFFLLRAQFSEGNCWLLVHRQSGRKTYISGLPHFSPDGRSLITRNLDLEAGYSFNGLAYYTLLQDSLVLNWELEINNWGPRNMKWLSDSSLLIEKSYWVGNGSQYEWEEASTQLTILPLHR
jgi:hypothetical protein